jgi:hypothetical protein
VRKENGLRNTGITKHFSTKGNDRPDHSDVRAFSHLDKAVQPTHTQTTPPENRRFLGRLCSDSTPRDTGLPASQSCRLDFRRHLVVRYWTFSTSSKDMALCTVRRLRKNVPLQVHFFTSIHTRPLLAFRKASNPLSPSPPRRSAASHSQGLGI